MPKQSAGVLLYRRNSGIPEILLVHPGGPFWSKKDIGAWSIPKGEYADDEKPLDAAIREFEEETGTSLKGDFIALKPVKLKSGKLIYAWALQGDLDATQIKSNTIQIVWPPKSKTIISIPEVDKAEWFTVEDAKLKINPAQCGFIDELCDKLR